MPNKRSKVRKSNVRKSNVRKSNVRKSKLRRKCGKSLKKIGLGVLGVGALAATGYYLTRKNKKPETALIIGGGDSDNKNKITYMNNLIISDHIGIMEKENWKYRGYWKEVEKKIKDYKISIINIDSGSGSWIMDNIDEFINFINGTNVPFILSGPELKNDIIPIKYKYKYMFKEYDPINDGMGKRLDFFNYNKKIVHSTKRININDNDLIFKLDDLKRINKDQDLRHFIRENTKPMHDLTFFANKIKTQM
jgi:hypothetical protein